MHMKDRALIAVLVFVLVISILQVGTDRLTNQEQKEVKQEDKQVIRVMSEMENQMAYEKAMENETTETNSKYANLYPEMYVEKIVPIEHDKDQKIAYLSFDDGPSEYTMRILEILKEKNAVATFFILGANIDITKDGEEALRQINEQGSAIGLHTFSHEKNDIYSSMESYMKDFNKVYNRVYEVTGKKPQIYRFPWGSYNKYCKGMKKELVTELDRRGFTYFDWNVSAEDSVGTPTASSIIKNIMKDVKKYNEPVILMHDSKINKLTVEMLPQIIDKLIEMGYSFGTLDERKPCQFCY